MEVPLGRPPFPRSIGVKAVFKLVGQFVLTREQLSRPAKKFVDADGFASAHNCDQIEFTSFNLLPRKAKRFLTDDNSRSVYFVRAHEPRGHIDGIANYREALGHCRPNRAQNYFSGGNSHVHAKSGRAAPKSDEVWQFFIKVLNRC